MSDRAFDLSKDLVESRLAAAETVDLISRIDTEPGSPGDRIKAAILAAVEILQHLHGARALIATATEQSWSLLERQPRLWLALRDRGELPRSRNLCDAWPAFERLEPATEPQRRLQGAMVECCQLLSTTHDSTQAFERQIERAWNYIDGLSEVLGQSFDQFGDATGDAGNSAEVSSTASLIL